MDVRFIASTNQNLEKMVQEGRFREDLYYRLNVFTLHMPPLRERKEDIPLLVDYFLQNLPHKVEISSVALQMLMVFPWPGNIRELENIIARAVAVADGTEIQVEDLPPFLAASHSPPDTGLQSLEEMERAHIAKVLRSVAGHRDKAASILGITRSTLWRKINKFGLVE